MVLVTTFAFTCCLSYSVKCVKFQRGTFLGRFQSYPPSHLTFPRCRITGLDFSSTATPVIWPTSNSIEGQFKTSAGFRIATSGDTLYKKRTNDTTCVINTLWPRIKKNFRQLIRVIPKVLPFRSSWMANYYEVVRARTAIRSTIVVAQLQFDFSNFWLPKILGEHTTNRSQRLQWRILPWWLTTHNAGDFPLILPPFQGENNTKWNINTWGDGYNLEDVCQRIKMEKV